MERNGKFGNLFTAGLTLAPKKNSAHGRVERGVQQAQAMLWMGDSWHQLFAHVLRPLGLGLSLWAGTGELDLPCGGTEATPPAWHCQVEDVCWGNPAAILCPTLAPLHSLSRRDAHATTPPPARGKARCALSQCKQ